MVKSGQFEIEPEGFGDILDITGEVAMIVAGSGLDAGIAIVFVPRDPRRESPLWNMSQERWKT